MVLRIEQSGGFVAVQYNLTRMPMLTLYGDGLIVTPGPQIEIYPGPALPALAQQRLTPRGGPARCSRPRSMPGWTRITATPR